MRQKLRLMLDLLTDGNPSDWGKTAHICWHRDGLMEAGLYIVVRPV